MNSLNNILQTAVKKYLICAEPSVFFRKRSTVTGQLSFFKHAGKLYGLGCYHVLCANELKHRIYKLSYSSADDSPIEIWHKTQTGIAQPMGKVLYGELNNLHDIAIAEINAPPEHLVPVMISYHQEHDLFFINKHGQFKYADIISANTSCIARLNEQLSITFNHLIKANKFSQKADSGALTWDASGTVVGLIACDNSLYTYIVPLTPNL